MMRIPVKLAAGLLLGSILAWSPPASAAPWSMERIRRELSRVEGLVSHFLTTIKPPKRKLTRKDRIRRLVDGMVLYRMQDYTRAAIVLTDLITSSPNTPEASEAAFLLADAMFQQREFILARTYFYRVVKEGSGNRYYQLALQRLLELEMKRASVLGAVAPPGSERLKQVEDLLQKIQAIPVRLREPSVEYVRGKYLFFRKRIQDAITVFSGIGPAHAYYLQAVYFTGVCYIKQKRLVTAQKIYKQLIDKVLFGYFKPKTTDQRRVLQLVIMAAARLAYYRGGTRNLEHAVELYNAIPRKSPYFDDALFERAWAYLKVKRYDRAIKTLELLEIANPKYERKDEASILLGNLKMHTRDFGGAKKVFRRAARELRPAFRKLRGLHSARVDPKTIFAQLTSKDLEAFDIKVRLPKVALRWLHRQPEVKRALIMLADVKAIRKMIVDSDRLIRRIERKLKTGSLISSVPQLAVARARAADMETRLLKIRGQVAAHLRALMKPLASPQERAQLDKLREQRKKLESALKKAPSSSKGYQSRIKRIKALFDKVDAGALAVAIQVKDLRAMLTAIYSYYYRTIKSQTLSRKTMEAAKEMLHKQIKMLSTMIRSIREDIRDGRDNVGIGDKVMQYEKQLRQRYKKVLRQEQRLAQTIASRMSGSQRRKKANLDVLLGRIQRAQQNVGRLNRRIDAFLAAKKAKIVAALGREKVNLTAYRKELASHKPETQEVVGGITYQNFQRVSVKVKNIVVKADVGVLDVVWAIKNLAKSTYERRESLYMRALEALKLKYREARFSP